MLKLGNREIERVHLAAIERHFYITGPIEDEDDYIDLIDALYQGKPSETIYIHLNTPGGRLDITMQILNALRGSDADVVTIADGQVASAGTLILFAAKQIAVQPFSYVMLRDGSEGALGKVNENLKQALFTSKLLSKIAKDVYVPFFSEEEVDEVLNGRDMWLTAEEVNLRIKTAIEQLDKGQDAEEQIQE